MSPSPYHKIISYQNLGGFLVGMLATPLVLHLTLRLATFGFKSPLTLEYVVIKLDNLIFHIFPMGYSYCSSELNRMFHNTRSVFHFSTALPSILQDYWYPTFILEFKISFETLNRNPNYTIRITLYHFRGLFNDYIQPIIYSQVISKSTRRSHFQLPDG